MTKEAVTNNRINDWQDQINLLSSDNRKIRQKLDRLATLRLLSFFGAFVLFLLAMWFSCFFMYLGSLILLAVFIAFLHRFRKLKHTFDYQLALQQVHKARIARRGTEWIAFPETGKAILDNLETAARHNTAPTHSAESVPDLDVVGQDREGSHLRHRYHLAKDLDVLGQDSLYQRINLAFSADGQARLAELLLGGLDEGDPRLRQSAVRELHDRKAFSTHAAALFRLAEPKNKIRKKTDPDRLAVKAVPDGETEHNRQKIAHYLLYLLPALTSLSVLGWLLLPGIGWLSLPAAVLCLGQIGLATVKLARNNRELARIEALSANVAVIRDLVAAVEKEPFASELLQHLKSEFKDRQGAWASESFDRLKRIGNLTAVRKNTLAWLLGNTFLLWDEHCVSRYRSWLSDTGRHLDKWLAVCAEFEALLSLAESANCYAGGCWPTLTGETGGVAVMADALHHPLIDGARSVANPAELHGGTYIITGSNMSGKTTYLRQVGLSVLMAQASCFIPAEQASIPLIPVYTSIRVDDNIADGISSFYAEILRIREMVEAGKSGQPMLALIDEIFRGTNSADRITGAGAAIRRLSGSRILLLVSTHDFELCELEHDPVIQARNRHFEEDYADNRIHFDYKIRDGRSRTTNAHYLLKMAGII